MSVLILAEHNHTQLSAATLSTITAATELGKPIQLLVAGYQCQAVIEQAQGITVLSGILAADSDNYQHFVAESMTPLIDHVLDDSVTHLLAPATTFGKNILPRVAAIRRVSQVSDIIAIVDHQTYQRPIYAGDAIATVRSKDSLQVLTVRPTAFKPVEIGVVSSAVTVTPIDFVAQQDQVSFVSIEQHESSRPDLATADIVISGGRGLGDQQTFDRLAAIADRLHAALGDLQ